MFDLETAITEWRRQMHAAGMNAPVPLDELESHLRDDLERQMRQGADVQRAFETAVARLGPMKVIQTEFAKGGGSMSHRRIHTTLLAAMAVYFAAAASMFLWLSSVSATAGPVGLPRTPEWSLPLHAALGLTYVAAILITRFARRHRPQTARQLSRILNWALLPVVPFGPLLGIYGMWIERNESRHAIAR